MYYCDFYIVSFILNAKNINIKGFFREIPVRSSKESGFITYLPTILILTGTGFTPASVSLSHLATFQKEDIPRHRFYVPGSGINKVPTAALQALCSQPPKYGLCPTLLNFRYFDGNRRWTALYSVVTPDRMLVDRLQFKTVNLIFS